MKYDILLGFKQYLKETMTPNTAKTYFTAVKKVFGDYNISSLGDVPKEHIIRQLKTFKTKNELSAAKNGLKKLYEYDSSLKLPDEADFKNIARHKRNKVKSKGKMVDFDQMMRKTNAIRDEKLKYAYRLAAISGLRVSEIADLEPGDISFSDGYIKVHVRNGKGGKEGNVICLKDEYLYERLGEYMKGMEADERIFYGQGYMRKYAYEHGIQMHDFRRAFAVLEKRELQNQGYSLKEANEVVQEQLRHTRFANTERYLSGRKIIAKKLRKEQKLKPKGSTPLVAPNHRQDLEAMEPQELYNLMSELDARDLTEPERQALKFYAGDGFGEINSALYGNQEVPDSVLEYIDILTECLERKEIPRNEVVYRGVSKLSVLFGEEAKNMAIEEIRQKYEGTLFISDGFSSTSIDESISKDFTGNQTGILMRISVPAKMKGMFLGDVCKYKESEILFQRKSVFKINHIDSDDKNIIVDASLIYQAKKKGNMSHGRKK